MPRITAETKREHHQRLIAAAAIQFAEHGVRDAKIDDISVSAGLAKGTIYNYFDSKDDVFRAVVSGWAAALEEARTGVVQSESTSEHLLELARADFGAIARHEDAARAAIRELLGGSSLVGEFIQRFAAIDREYVSVLRLGQLRNEIRTDRDPVELGRVFVSMQNGLLLDRWIGNLHTPIEAFPELVLDHFLVGAAAQSLL